MKSFFATRHPWLLVLFIFCGISAIIIYGGYMYYTYRKDILRQEKYNDLKAIADLKEAQILNWKAERSEDARTIIYNPFTRKNFHKILDSNYKAFLPIFTGFLQTAKADFGYYKIAIFSKDGKLLACSDPDIEIPAESIRKYMDIGGRSSEISFIGFDLVDDTISLVELVVPILRDGTYGGFALFQMDPEKYLYPLIRLWPTPSKSSETLIFSVHGDEITFLNELRHQQHSSFRLKIPLTEKQVAAVMAAEGATGFVEATDYRGHAVLAYLKQIPGTGWYMVAKTDQDEIFQPMKQEAILITVSVLVMIIFIGFFSYLLVRYYLSSYFLQKVGKELGLKSAEDVMRRKQNENRIRKLNRLYSTLLSINQVVVRTKDREKMLRSVCTILIEKADYLMVSIGEFESDRMKVLASAGRVEDYFDHVQITKDASGHGSGPTGMAMKNNKYDVCQDIGNDPRMTPWHTEAEKRGYRSCAAFPIRFQDEVSGIMTIYSGTVSWFDQEEIDLLEQLSNDIGYALGLFSIEEKSREISKDLEISEKKFQQVFTSMNDGVALHELVFDAENKPVDYRLLDVNPMFEAITLIPSRKAVGMLGSALYHTTPPPYFDIYSRVATTGVSSIFEDYFAPMQKHFRISCFSQSKNGFTTVFQDISTQVEAREYLKKMNTELEKRVADRTMLLETANRELESFAYSVSHDLKAPLRSISSFSGILESRYGSAMDDEGKHFLQNIIKAGANMHNLIEDLLRYARLGKISPGLSPVDLKAFFELCLTDLHANIGSSGALITLPEETIFIHGNTLLLSQAFNNLILNGLIYLPVGRRPEMTISWHEEEDHVIISVRDNGIGIPERFHEKVFQMFQRLHHDEEFPGTGIGLAIVKKVVDIHGGEVWIAQSETNGGSTFCVKLQKSNDL